MYVSLSVSLLFGLQDIVDLATDFIQQDINAQTFLEYEKFVAFGDYGISSQKVSSINSCSCLQVHLLAFVDHAPS